MKLLAILRKKIGEEQKTIACDFANQLGFKSHCDSKTVIERDCSGVKGAYDWIKRNKEKILDSFPKENCKKLSSLESIGPETSPNDVLIIFKQILRAPSIRARMISRKRYDWIKADKRQAYTLEYRIITEHQQPSNVVSKVQNTPIHNTQVQNTQHSKPSPPPPQNSPVQQPQVHTTQPPPEPPQTQLPQVQPPQTQQPQVPLKQVPDTQIHDDSQTKTEPATNTNTNNTDVPTTQVPNAQVLDDELLDDL